MKRTIMLNGYWKLKGEGERPEGGPTSIDIDARVPGHVHQDLLAAGCIADPGYRKQAEDCAWVEHWRWTYSREFEVERLDAGRMVLEFEGLDTFADVYLNGTRVARTDNMFVRYRFDVSGLLRKGTNELEVRFRTIAEGVENKPYSGRGAAFTSERLYVRRMQCTFGWDWVGRLVSYGIWRPVRLVFEDVAAIEDLYVHTKAIDGRGAAIGFALETIRHDGQPLRVEAAILDPSGRIVWEASRKLLGNKLELTADLAEPELWWPAGYGGQPLYKAVAKLYGETGIVDERECSFGVRTARIEQLPDKPGSAEARTTEELRARSAEWDMNGERPGSGFTLLVNGVPIYCKGANWVPSDPFPSRIPDSHYENLLRLARDADMTMLRCWGGGIYEPEPFWDGCDKLGILVFQDFMMACGTYPEEDGEWAASLAVEAEGVIRSLRSRPSLIMWNGDNENGMFDGEDDPDYPGRAIAERITGRLCAELDPSRSFLPTSPFGGNKNNSFTIGTAHYTGALFDIFDYLRHTDMRDYRAYFAGLLSRFCPEFPMFGTPEIHTLRRFMSEEDLNDPSFDMLEYHTKNHPGLVDFTLFRALETLADKLMPPAVSTVEKIRHMSYAQHEITRLVLEAYRRNRPYTGGILFWMFNDCWPASGWSLVDYYGYPKGGYYGFKKAARPVIASIDRQEKEGGYTFWVCNDKPEAILGTARLRVLKLDGKADDASRWSREFSFGVGGGTSSAIETVPLEELDALLDDSHLLVMDISGPFGEDRCVYFTGIPADMELEASGVRIESRQEGTEGGRLIITADRYAKAVLLHGEYVFSDNYFDLLPDERRTIDYRRLATGASAGAGGNGEIELISWN
ncbi:beta-mannosidase [Cohnella abietis]|uniref:beta-mannosidase n=1 Tax=Cohnella abietis TaxID=2507935 RepID=A0A3T1DEI7_9BACL|nr:glycoside hydrolase family 2 protein [Cohnella abietis]BBI36571.1 beta-mannosidase [Cohnella abietis]